MTMNSLTDEGAPAGNGMSRDDAQALRWSSVLVIACALLFAVAIAMLHLLQPAIDPIKQTISFYATGAYGFLLPFTMLCAPVMMGSLAFGFHRSFARPLIRSRLQAIPSALAGCAFLLVALFPISSNEGIVTTSDYIHVAAAYAGVLWVHLAMLRLSLHCRAEPRWKPVAQHLTVLAIAAFVVFTLFSPFLAPIRSRATAGLAQRFDIALMLLWCLLSAFRLRAMARRP